MSWGNPGAHAVIQTDGNLVVYGTAGEPLWNAGTWGKPGGALYVQVDGNLVVHQGGAAVWNSGTVQRATSGRRPSGLLADSRGHDV